MPLVANPFELGVEGPPLKLTRQIWKIGRETPHILSSLLASAWEFRRFHFRSHSPCGFGRRFCLLAGYPTLPRSIPLLRNLVKQRELSAGSCHLRGPQESRLMII